MGWQRGGAHSSGGWHEVQGRRGRTAGRRPESGAVAGADQSSSSALETHGLQPLPANASTQADTAATNTGQAPDVTDCSWTDFPPCGGAIRSGQKCGQIGLSEFTIGTSSATRGSEGFLPQDSSSSNALLGCGSWEVVVDRTFIDVLVPGAIEDSEVAPRCRSAPGDLGLYSVHERVVAESIGDSTPRVVEEDTFQAEASCGGSDDSMPPIIQNDLADDIACDKEPEESHNDDDDDNIEAGDGKDDMVDDSGSVEALWRLLQERDEEIRLLKKAVESAQETARALGRNAQEAKAEKEIRALRQRNSTLEKSVSKQEADIKKRNSEIAELKDALAIKEAEVAEKDARLQEFKDTELVSKEISQPTPSENTIEIVARHALEDVELKVKVSSDASFRDVKKAIATKVGSDEILAKGRLLKKQKGGYFAHQDKAKVGNVREVLVLGADLEVVESQVVAPTEGHENANSRASEGFEARIAELETLVTKKDNVLRGVLGELKRLREEQSKTKEVVPQNDKRESPETMLPKMRSNHRPPLPVVDVAKLAKADKASGRRAVSSAMEAKKNVSQASPLRVADMAGHHQSGLPPKSTMWKALVASRAKLNLNRNDAAANAPSCSSKLDENQSWSLSQFVRSEGAEEEKDASKTTSAASDMVEECAEDLEAACNKQVQGPQSTNSDGDEASCPDKAPPMENDESERTQFSISSFVRGYFGSNAQMHEMKEGLAAITERPLLSKFLSERSNSGVSNAETLTVSSGDEPMFGQGSELDSEIDFAATVYGKDAGDEIFAGDLVIADSTQAADDGESKALHQSKSPSTDEVVDSNDRAADRFPRHHSIGFACKVAARAARKDAQTRARGSAAAPTVSGNISASSSGVMTAPRSIPISAGIRPKWRLNNSTDIGL